MARIFFISDTRARYNVGMMNVQPLGGIESTNIELGAALAARGHDVTLATPTDETMKGMGLLNIPLSEIGNVDADVVISSNNLKPFDRVSKSARKFLWVHNPLIIEKMLRKGQIAPLLRHRPHGVFLSNWSMKAASRLLPFKGRSVIYHGISESFRTPTPTAGEKPFAVWASEPQRGLPHAIQVWKTLVAPHFPSAQFHVFGNAAAYLGAAAEGLDAHGIILQGRQPKEKLIALYQQARLFFYPGHMRGGETFCLAASEAQCMGLPVVTSGIGALSDRVAHDLDGLISQDDSELGTMIVRLLSDDIYWTRLHEGALTQRQKLTWENSAIHWEQTLGLA
ncbi:MAG: glycosyltransferase [Rhizobiales bacterium]|nr:glycosyltransferase [Hyphomicrobiales bacterium]